MSTTGKWECPHCGKILAKRSAKYHIAKTCGKNALECEICGVCFKTRDAKYRHKKLCKAANVVSNNYDHSTHNDHCTITNNNTTNNNTTININHFGKEELGYILENVQTDERIKIALKNLVDTIRLVHFNSEHPENHNIRKKCKNDTLMEYRLANRPDEWTTDSYHTVLKKVQKNLENNLDTQFMSVPRPFQLQREIYLLTHKDPTPSEVILKQFEPEEIEPRKAALVEILQERDIRGCMWLDPKYPNKWLVAKKITHGIAAKYGFHPLSDRQLVDMFSMHRRVPVLTPITEPVPVFEPVVNFPMSEEERYELKKEQQALKDAALEDRLNIDEHLRRTTSVYDPRKGRMITVYNNST